MRDSSPQQIYMLLASRKDSALFSTIQPRVVALLKLNNAISVLLPAPLRPWCRVANFRNGVLVIETANASWLIRLRYEQKKLLSALRTKILPSLSSINLRINPELAIKGNSWEAPRHVSEKIPLCSLQSAEYIRNVAAGNNIKLQKLLERLAELVSRTANQY